MQADRYLLLCQRYIELNPVRAAMVDDPANYRWSSYRANGLGQAAPLLTPHPVYAALDRAEVPWLAAYRALFREGRDLSDLAVVLDLACTAGADREALAEALAGPLLRERLKVECAEAIARGVCGSPFIIVDFAWIVNRVCGSAEKISSSSTIRSAR